MPVRVAVESPIAETGSYSIERHSYQRRIVLTVQDSTYEMALVNLTPDEALGMAAHLTAAAQAMQAEAPDAPPDEVL